MDDLNCTEKATILVVDDDPGNLALMSNMLKDDYKVKVANGGEKALKIAASDSPPDLIMLDIVMPGMDGFEVCRQLKNNPETMDIPVIFLTARTEEEDENKGLELGAIDYISKPVRLPIVMARVKNHLALHQRSSLVEVEARHKWLKNSLEKFITQQEQKQPEVEGNMAVPEDREQLNAVCDKLEILLVNDDAEAFDVLDANAELLNDAFPSHSHEIENSIRSFDFDAALVALRDVRATLANQ